MFSLSTTAEGQQPKVYTGDSFTELNETPNLFCLSCSLRLAPHMSSVSLLHHYGTIAHAGQAFGTVAPSDLRGKYVQVTLMDTNGETEVPIFQGLIASQRDIPLGTEQRLDVSVPTGDNVYTAYSLDYLLDRVYIDRTYLEVGESVRNVLSFNGTGNRLERNRSAAIEQDQESYHFDYSDTAENWTALQIITYLMDRFQAGTGLLWSMSDAYEHLDNLTPSLNPEGKTLRQCLNEILQPTRGMSYRVTYNHDTTRATIEVISLSDVDIKLNGNTILPASKNTVTLNSTIETSRNIDNVSIQQIEESAYSSIQVISEPVRIMATLKLGTGTGGMSKDWEADDETAYIAADDLTRQDEKYERVYAAFALSSDWDRTAYNDQDLIPLVDDTDLSATYNFANPTAFLAHAFERTLPIPLKTANDRTDYRKPFLLVKDTDGNYHISDKITFDGQKAASIGFKVMDSAPGIILRNPWQHIIAKDTFSASSANLPMYDFRDCLATVSFYTDSMLCYTIPGVALPNGRTRTKLVHLPGYHYWVAAPETYTDRDTKTADQWTPYKDDREELKKIALLVQAWYGRIRNAISFTSRQLYPCEYLGYMISQFYTGGAFAPAGTVVSSVSYDFMSQKVTAGTEFADVDFSRLSSRSQKNSSRAMAKRINRLEETTMGLNIREPKGGGTGEASAPYDGPFAAVQQSATKVRILGYDASASRELKNYATIGTKQLEIDQTDVTVSATGWVYLELAYSAGSGNYTPVWKTSANYPAPAAGYFKFPVCWVEVVDSAITDVQQIQYGQIHHPGTVAI